MGWRAPQGERSTQQSGTLRALPPHWGGERSGKNRAGVSAGASSTRRKSGRFLVLTPLFVENLLIHLHKELVAVVQLRKGMRVWGGELLFRIYLSAPTVF